MTELDQRPGASPGTDAPAGPSRRQILLTGGIAAAAAAVTAACGSSSAGTTTAPTSSAPAGGGASSIPASGSSPASGGTTVPTSDVPVGGGTILADQQVVVTQPSAGQYKAFTAVCTHQGCIVASVANGVIVCPCHGSTFSIADGSVQGGPAPAPLSAVPVTVSGSTITVSA